MQLATLVRFATFVLATSLAFAAPLTDINQYADRCAAELGAGTGSYMPLELLPAPGMFADTREIPVYWNQKRITFEETSAGEWEFLFDGKPGAVGYPDGANTRGRILERHRSELKCDYWSHINTSTRTCTGGVNIDRECRNNGQCPGSTCSAVVLPTGCFPGQRMLQREVGTCSVGGAACNATPCAGAGTCEDIVTWGAVFRRVQPPRAGQLAFNPFHPFFFNNFDVIAFKQGTGAACWFDTLGTRTLQRDRWWEAAAGTPAGVPRPGGKDTAKQARAVPFWMTPEAIQHPTQPDQRCPVCHGNGPILASRWINNGNVFRSSSNSGREIAYWHPAKLFDNPLFKTFDAAGKPAQECGDGCHRAWSISAETMPGGFLARDMTEPATAATPLASHYRRQINAAGNPLAMTCIGGTNVGQACIADAGCPNSTCAAGQRAGILREMPHPFRRGTPADWTTNVQPLYDAMKACLQSCVGGTRPGEACGKDADCPGSTCRLIVDANCSGAVRAEIPKFFGAQIAPPAGKSQFIRPPFVADGVGFLRHGCVIAADGAESCLYQVQWQDPTAGESDYFAADRYYVVENEVPNEAGRTPATSRFCSTTTTPATTIKTDLGTSNWAKRHVNNGTLRTCRKTELRLCGGYAIDSAPDANDAHAPVDSRNDGDAQRATLVTACANAVKATLSGFRLHRATNRYVQTVTLKNEGAAAVDGPVTLLLFGLSPNATLFGGGKTVAIVPAGTSFVSTAHAGLAAGASVILQLQFTNPTNQGITYDARVRTGASGL